VIDGGLGPRTKMWADELRAAGVDVQLACGHLPDCRADLAVISPGIPASHPWVRALAARGIPCTSELAFAAARIAAPKLAVTGTNGKTTTVQMLTHILRAAGKRAVAAGNIGRSLSELALTGEQWDVIVVEVSSFQLELGVPFQPLAAALLNVTSDHLDRHGNMANYAALKASLLTCLPAAARVLRSDVARDLTIEGECFSQPDKDLPPLPASLPGPHNVENALAATALAERAGVARRAAWDSLESFSLDGHRLQLVSAEDGIRVFNDSKSTNPDALARALDACGAANDVVLIAGGRDKAMDFAVLLPRLRSLVREVHLFGENRAQLAALWAGAVRCVEHDGLESAITAATGIARRGDTILFSPGCASQDMFIDYKQRGASFVTAIKRRHIA